MEWSRRLRGYARHARKLARMGWSTGAIMRAYGLDRDEVRLILAPAVPPPPRAPRPPRERVPRVMVRREWGHAHGPDFRDEPAPPPAIAEAPAPGPPDAGPPPMPPALAEDWGPVAGGRIGERSPAAALGDDDAALIRELRARRVPRKDLAGRFGVSVATVTRITRGETYRPVRLEPARVVSIEPPAIAAAEGPVPTVWSEPRRPGRRRPPEHRDD